MVENYKLQYLESIYENLTEIASEDHEEHHIYLAKNSQTGEIVVKKYVDAAVVPIYRSISQVHDSRLEKVLYCAEDGKRGLVILEYISGITLSSYMSDHGLFTIEDTCGIICNLLEILTKIHKSGIIHRDIKPENIIISSDGMVKLVDFGISRKKKESQTSDTTILGTVGYAAPEQYGFAQSDERTDIYAVGVLFNQLLTRGWPRERMYPQEPVRSMITRCTQMDANQRYQSAEELLSELRGYIRKSGLWKKSPNFYTYLDNKKREMPYIWLPGFRTGKAWKMVIASLGYALMMIYSFIYVAVFVSVGWQQVILNVVAIILGIWINTFLALNVGDWDQKVPIIRRWPRAVRIIFRIILWFVMYVKGMSIMVIG